jgi:hypothetical protein
LRCRVLINYSTIFSPLDFVRTLRDEESLCVCHDFSTSRIYRNFAIVALLAALNFYR